MASVSPGALALSSLPYEYRQHLDKVVRHLRTLHSDLDAEWDGLVSNAARAMAEDARGWLGALRKSKDVLFGMRKDVVEVFERKEDEPKKVSPKGKGKGKDEPRPRDVSKSRSRPGSPVHQPRQSKLVLGSSTLDWLHSRIDATSTGISRLTTASDVPALLLLTFPPHAEAPPHTRKACIWEAGKFSLPLFQDDEELPAAGTRAVLHEAQPTAELLFPIAEPHPASSLHRDARIVGGTFRIKGATSLAEEKALRDVIRLAVYASLSLLLESSFLRDLDISFVSTPPPSMPTSPVKVHVPLPSSLLDESKFPETKHKVKPSTIWRFLTQKSSKRKPPGESDLDQHTLISGRTISPPPLPPKDTPGPPNSRGRTLSILSRRPTVLKRARTPPPPRFQHTLSQLHTLPLSTSPSVTFTPSTLLVDLRARETEYLKSPSVQLQRARSRSPSRSRTPDTKSLPLSGFDRAALRSLRGSDDTLHGWLGHQAMTVLHSRWVHDPNPSLPPSSTSSSLQSVPGTPKLEEPKTPDPDRRRALACIPPQWRTLVYFDGSADRTLGAVISGLCSLPGKDGGAPCSREKCDKPWVNHRWGWSCAGLRVEARLGRVLTSGSQSIEDTLQPIQMWTECSECGSRTQAKAMGEGSCLISFAKYLELLIFSHSLSFPGLCDHTRHPQEPSGHTDLPPSASSPSPSVLYHFRRDTTMLTFSLCPTAVYELRVPRLQIGIPAAPDVVTDDHLQTRREALRMEITSTFGHSKRWTERLESQLREMKRLPHRPHRENSDSTTRSPSPTHDVVGGASMTSAAVNKHLSAASSLRAHIHSEEAALYDDLRPWSLAPLNDVRRRYVSTAGQIRDRIQELERIYAANIGLCTWDEPSWWKGGLLVLPGSWVMFREDEVGAIISYTLSSLDYKRALDDSYAAQPVMARSAQDAAPSDSSTTPNLETWSAVVTRRENPRDVAALLTMIGSKRGTVNGSALKSSPSNSPPSKLAANGTPKDAWAPADVAISYQSARGDLNAADDVLVQKLLQDMDGDAEAARSEIKRSPGRLSNSASPPLDRRTSVSSVAGQQLLSSMPSEPSVPSLSSSAQHKQMESQTDSLTRSRSSRGSTSTIMQLPLTLQHGTDVSIATSASTPPSSFANGYGTFTDVMSYLTTTTKSLLFGPSESDSSITSRLPLLAMDRARSALPIIEERPHIRYDWSVGRRLKFACTVYYAQQFEALRRLCGVDLEMIESLAECVEWKAEGGKSRSRFFKSKDDRYIIKTLVNAWHVSDLQVLLDVSPILFRYIDSLGDKPTTLAKLLGFYSIEVKNAETSAQTKVDVLVMENLFYNQQTNRQYDLKGIEGRRVKTSDKNTLFDVEFMESQKKDPILVTPYSRLVVRDAIRGDAAFLTSSNIMDYSMLLGVDDGNQHVACGLVDTIGSYNVAKTLEYTAKQSLKSGKQVTVMPPAEYEARFVSAMESYLIACPDKWTKPARGQTLPSAVTDLPAVL